MLTHPSKKQGTDLCNNKRLNPYIISYVPWLLESLNIVHAFQKLIILSNSVFVQIPTLFIPCKKKHNF